MLKPQMAVQASTHHGIRSVDHQMYSRDSHKGSRLPRQQNHCHAQPKSISSCHCCRQDPPSSSIPLRSQHQGASSKGAVYLAEVLFHVFWYFPTKINTTALYVRKVAPHSRGTTPKLLVAIDALNRRVGGAASLCSCTTITCFDSSPCTGWGGISHHMSLVCRAGSVVKSPGPVGKRPDCSTWPGLQGS